MAEEPPLWKPLSARPGASLARSSLQKRRCGSSWKAWVAKQRSPKSVAAKASTRTCTRTAFHLSPIRARRWADDRGRSIDFLAKEEEGTGHGRRTQVVQAMHPRRAPGCDVALELATEVPSEGSLPDGDRDSARVPVAFIVPFLVLKAMALSACVKEKNAWGLRHTWHRMERGSEAGWRRMKDSASKSCTGSRPGSECDSSNPVHIRGPTPINWAICLRTPARGSC